MLKVTITYPNKEEEKVILQRMAVTKYAATLSALAKPEDILRLRSVVDDIYIDEKVQNYIVDLVEASRNPQDYGLADLNALILAGASPRATINLALASKAYALLQGRGYVTPEDVKAIGLDVLRHRIMPSYEAEAEEKTTEDLVMQIFNEVAIP